MKDPLWREKHTHPDEWDFFQALRWLENRFRNRPRLGRSVHPDQDPIRLGQRPDLRFPTSTLEDVENANPNRPPRLNVKFFGFFGPNGPLPFTITEFVRDRVRHARDTTLKAFLDIFHHRFLTFFYRAWALNQKSVDFDRPQESRFTFYLSSLIGQAGNGLHNRDSIPDLAKIYHTGRLAPIVRNAEGLHAILSDYFQVPVRLESWIGHWLSLPKENRCILGNKPQGTALGVDSVLGARIWQVQTRFRICVGPMNLARYRDFLPCGPSWQRLVDWVQLYTTRQWEWEAQLLLSANETPPLALNGASQLGWTTWLNSMPPSRDADDLLLASPDNHL